MGRFFILIKNQVKVFSYIFVFVFLSLCCSAQAYSGGKWQKKVDALLWQSSKRVKAYYKKEREDQLYNEKRLKGAGRFKDKREREKKQRDRVRKNYARKKKSQQWELQKKREQEHSDYLLTKEEGQQRRLTLRENYIAERDHVRSVLKEKTKKIPSSKEMRLLDNWMPSRD